MTSAQIASLAVAAVVLFWAIGAHNRLITLRNAIGSAWTRLDALLQRRQALLQALLPALRSQIGGETHALDAVQSASLQAAACADPVRARPSAAPAVAGLAMAERVFGGAMGRLLALLDEHPAASGDAEVAPRIAELVEIETRLGFARLAFNEAVGAFNDAARQFPTRLLSKAFGLRAAGRL